MLVRPRPVPVRLLEPTPWVPGLTVFESISLLRRDGRFCVPDFQAPSVSGRSPLKLGAKTLTAEQQAEAQHRNVMDPKGLSLESHGPTVKAPNLVLSTCSKPKHFRAQRLASSLTVCHIRLLGVALFVDRMPNGSGAQSRRDRRHLTQLRQRGAQSSGPKSGPGAAET